VPAARPRRHKPRIDPSAIVTRGGSEQNKAKQAERAAQQRQQARAAAEARRKLIGQLGQVASQLGDNLSGVAAIQIPYGPGGGGLPYANFYQAVQSIYTREWLVPDGATEKETTTVAEVTIARDGTVVVARIVRFSGNAVVDESVQLTLDRVRRLVPLPASAEEDQRTVTINFNAKPESKRALE
jgi:outer membrane biosynthesis protein TonB